MIKFVIFNFSIHSRVRHIQSTTQKLGLTIRPCLRPVYPLGSSKLIDVFAGATLDFFAANRELEHNSAILALLFADLGRGHLVDGLAAGAFHLLGASDELKHAAAVVADQVRAGHWGDAGRD